jgi:hypothetical protein
MFDLVRLTPQLALPHVIDIDGIRVSSGYYEVFLEIMLWSGLNKPITCACTDSKDQIMLSEHIFKRYTQEIANIVHRPDDMVGLALAFSVHLGVSKYIYTTTTA